MSSGNVVIMTEFGLEVFHSVWLLKSLPYVRKQAEQVLDISSEVLYGVRLAGIVGFRFLV